MKKIITLFALAFSGYMATAQVKIGLPAGKPTSTLQVAGSTGYAYNVINAGGPQVLDSTMHFIYNNTVSANAYVLPAAGTCTGREYVFKSTGGNDVITVASAGTMNTLDQGGGITSYAIPANSSVTFFAGIGNTWQQTGLSRNAASTGVNIYNGDGTLTGTRTVTMAGNTLNFAGANVGFGTPSPLAKLHLTGSGFGAGIFLSQTGAANGRTYSVASRFNNAGRPVFAVADENAGAYRMVIDSIGEVGIGTADPAAKLHIVSTGTGGTTVSTANTANIVQRLENTGNGQAVIQNFLAKDASGNAKNALIGVNPTYNGGNGILYIGRTGNNDMSMDLVSGNVGIGQGTPTSNLDILNNGAGGTAVTSANTSNMALRLAGNQNGEAIIQQFTAKDASGNAKNALIGINPTYNGGNGILYIGRNGTNDLLMDLSTGNIGIGGIPASSRLDVNGEVTIRTLPSAAATYSVVTADASGNLHRRTINDLINGTPGVTSNIYNGDGTLTSARTVTMAGNLLAFSGASTLFQGGSGIFVDNSNLNGATFTNGLHFGSNSAEGIASNRSGAGVNQSGLDFYTLGNNRMSVTNAGNIGIGTSTPGQLLHVRGTSPQVIATSSAIPASGSFLGLFGVGANNGGSTDYQSSGLNVNATENWTTTASGSQINLITTPNGTTARAVRMTVNNDGNVGIGTTSPTQLLHVRGTSPQAIITSSAIPVNGGFFGLVGMGANNGSAADYQSAGINAYATENWTTTASGSQLRFITSANGTTARQSRMVIDHNGNVGIGTTSPTSNLYVTGNGNINTGGIIVSAGALTSGQVINGTANVNAVQVSSEYVSSQRSDVNYFAAHPTGTVNTTNFMNFYYGGTVIGSIAQNTTSSIAVNTTSDIRLKENVRPTAYGLADLMKIQVSDYSYKTDKTIPQTGFIAQQLYNIFPMAVTQGGEDAKTKPWQVDYSKLTPLLTKAIQDQQAEIASLKADVELLKKAVEALQKK